MSNQETNEDNSWCSEFQQGPAKGQRWHSESWSPRCSWCGFDEHHIPSKRAEPVMSSSSFATKHPAFDSLLSIIIQMQRQITDDALMQNSCQSAFFWWHRLSHPFVQRRRPAKCRGAAWWGWVLAMWANQMTSLTMLNAMTRFHGAACDWQVSYESQIRDWGTRKLAITKWFQHRILLQEFLAYQEAHKLQPDKTLLRCINARNVTLEKALHCLNQEERQGALLWQSELTLKLCARLYWRGQMDNPSRYI